MATAKKAAKKARRRRPRPRRPPGEESGAGKKARPRRPPRPRRPREEGGPGQEAHPERGLHEGDDAEPALAAIIGDKPMPRTEVTKKVWEYIKKNKLQDAVKRRMINADAKLKEIFKKAQASMFEMTKMINAHLK